MKPFPAFTGNIAQWAKALCQTHAENVREYDKAQSFVKGIRIRTDRAVPTSSANVVGGDRVGDIVLHESGIYYVADNAGTPEWREIASNSF